MTYLLQRFQAGIWFTFYELESEDRYAAEERLAIMTEGRNPADFRVIP